MPVYKEKEDKLNFNIAEDSEVVEITITTFNGTEASVSYGFPPKNVDSDNPSNEIGTASELKNKNVFFSGSANNPSRNNNKVKHEIRQGSKSLIYSFPDDYTGSQSYTSTGDSIAYRFNVKFD